MDDADVVGDLIRTAIAVVAALAGYWLLSRAGRAWVSRMGRRDHEHGARAATLWSMIRRVVGVLVFIVFVLTILSVWEVDLGPLVAVGSAVGVAVGFGAQSLVKDVIAGFFMLAEDQFSIGDWVTIADTSGEVREIRLRVTVLRDVEGSVHYVPNGEVRVTTNQTQVYSQVVLDLMVTADTPVDTVIDVLSEELALLAADPEWREYILESPDVLGVQELDGLGVTVRALVKTTPDGRWLVRREALRRLKHRLDREGIEIPIPPLRLER